MVGVSIWIDGICVIPDVKLLIIWGSYKTWSGITCCTGAIVIWWSKFKCSGSIILWIIPLNGKLTFGSWILFIESILKCWISGKSIWIDESGLKIGESTWGIFILCGTLKTLISFILCCPISILIGFKTGEAVSTTFGNLISSNTTSISPVLFFGTVNDSILLFIRGTEKSEKPPFTLVLTLKSSIWSLKSGRLISAKTGLTLIISKSAISVSKFGRPIVGISFSFVNSIWGIFLFKTGISIEGKFLVSKGWTFNDGRFLLNFSNSIDGIVISGIVSISKEGKLDFISGISIVICDRIPFGDFRTLGVLTFLEFLILIISFFFSIKLGSKVAGSVILICLGARISTFLTLSLALLTVKGWWILWTWLIIFLFFWKRRFGVLWKRWLDFGLRPIPVTSPGELISAVKRFLESKLIKSRSLKFCINLSFWESDMVKSSKSSKLWSSVLIMLNWGFPFLSMIIGEIVHIIVRKIKSLNVFFIIIRLIYL